jgi:DNA (cytosine-5)-methyltransferase 1
LKKPRKYDSIIKIDIFWRIFVKKRPVYKVLDTFAGAGGFSLGFEQAGCIISGAIEIDDWASSTFAYNHPQANVITADIRLLDDKELYNQFKNSAPDIILGGPPCQGFSIANINKGDPKDPRNTLFQEFIRLGKLFSPQIMIMENVPNLTNIKTETKENVTDIIQVELKKLEYNVYMDILSAVDYGVPQIRKRLFIIASKKPLKNPFPTKTHDIHCDGLFAVSLQKTPTLWEAISDLPEIEAREGAEEMDYTNNPQNEYQEKMRNYAYKVYNHKAMKHSKRLVERFSSMKWGESTTDVPEYLKPIKRNSGNEISDKAYDQNNRRMFPDRPCHTIPASFYANFVHPYKNRNFTAREGARIQSFPDNYVFKGKATVVSHKLLTREKRLEEKFLCQYSQIGNAVPPLMAKAVAENIINQL